MSTNRHEKIIRYVSSQDREGISDITYLYRIGIKESLLDWLAEHAWSYQALKVLRDDKMSLLMRIRKLYSLLETDENKKRKKALEEAVQELAQEGYDMWLFVGWSLAARQSLPESDIEVTLCIQHASQEAEIKSKLSNIINKKMGRSIKLDYWGQTVILEEIPWELDIIKTGRVESLSATSSLYRAAQLGLYIGRDCYHILTNIKTLATQHIILKNSIESLEIDDMIPFFKVSLQKYRRRILQNPDFLAFHKHKQDLLIKELDQLERSFTYQSGFTQNESVFMKKVL